MLKPSDFNNAVPQFPNGSYASNPINPQYIAEPDAENYNKGTEPLQTLPAQWWNWFLNKFTSRFNKINIYVKNIFNELAQVLSIFNITPDGTEQTPTTSQLKTVFETCYPQYVKTVTTGTAVGCIPTVGTALGTTNNNILVTDSTGKLKPSGITVGTAAGCAATFFAKKTELDALYGNIAGTALGTAAVGTCTTFARSDHVHPVTGLATTCVDCSNYPGLGNAGDYVEYLRAPLRGFLPCTEDNINGSGYVGTQGWPFAEINAKLFCGTLCGDSSTALNVRRNPYGALENLDIALFAGCDWSGDAPLFVSNNCRLTYNPNTGVLTAKCFDGNASCATYVARTSTQDNTRFYFSLFNDITTVGVSSLYVSSGHSLTYNPFTGDLENTGLYYTSNGVVVSCIGHLNNDYLHIYTNALQGIAMNNSLLLTNGSVTASCFCGNATSAGVTCTFGLAVGRRNETMRQWSATWDDSTAICDIYKAICWAMNDATCFGTMSIVGSIGCSVGDTYSYACALERLHNSEYGSYYRIIKTSNYSECIFETCTRTRSPGCIGGIY